MPLIETCEDLQLEEPTVLHALWDRASILVHFHLLLVLLLRLPPATPSFFGSSFLGDIDGGELAAFLVVDSSISSFSLFPDLAPLIL
jgi:hypothetical protein